MLAVELVPLDVREDPMGESDHLIVGLPLLLGAEEVPIVLDQLPALRLELLDRPLEGLTRLDPGDVAGEACEGHGQVIVPGAVVVVEAVPWFNINVGDGFYHDHRSWNDGLRRAWTGHRSRSGGSGRSRPLR